MRTINGWVKYDSCVYCFKKTLKNTNILLVYEVVGAISMVEHLHYKMKKIGGSIPPCPIINIYILSLLHRGGIMIIFETIFL